MKPEKVVLDGDDMRRTLVRIAHEIVEQTRRPGTARGRRHPPPRRLPRGAACTTCSCDLLDADVPLGDVDISFYRDDLGHAARRAAWSHATQRRLRPSTARTVVIVDDVLFTGRTVRAAIDALFDYGRPARVQLAVLADRGHRELPIRPDYVGKNLPTARGERVQRARRASSTASTRSRSSTPSRPEAAA